MVCPEEFAAAIAATGIALTKGKSTEELAILAILFIQLGYTIESVIAQREYIEKCCNKENSSNLG
ncbi:hypothetical protein RBG61_09475 [Paludicola sp. MB14-C6]|uniref:DUF6774 domain-containing protein n=1 Tax=Paludihabitans sp. MB14-C6 TaxID=3070656 RepID=UPI0027DBBB74|nr:DUF6774 domain-containing protein [Paludicola sp. MB14-C6]WMJ22217.1 hypothetical protein RBG61_09475 [Paludicola sp. MB14-C6]